MIIMQENKEWIERVLSQFTFIKWDRFSKFINGDDTILRVFGWIDREQDSYKDFAVFEFVWDDKTRMVFLISTSSKHWSRKIDELLAGNNDGHVDCQRIEHNFNIMNSIKLPKCDCGFFEGKQGECTCNKRYQ